MERLVSYRQLADHYGVSLRTMYNRVHRGDAPTPQLSVTGRVIGWKPSEIRRYDEAHSMTRSEYLYSTT